MKSAEFVGPPKAAGRPVASVSAAFKRFEAAIAVPLVRREGGNLVPTLEAQSAAGRSGGGEPRRTSRCSSPRRDHRSRVPSISLAALDRFVTVARSGSIRGAAKIAGAGQPQLTRQMADLERDLAMRLLDPLPVRHRLYTGGPGGIPIAESLLDIWRRLSRASGDRFRRTAATWRFGSVMPLGPESEIARMLAALTAKWHRARPRQPLFISSTTADELIAGLKSRRFDVVLLDLETFPAEFEGRLVSRTPIGVGRPSLAVYRTRRGYRGAASSQPDRRSQPEERPSPTGGAFLGEILGEQERNRLTVIEVDSIPVILNLVMNHGYLSMLPESSAARVRNAPGDAQAGAGLHADPFARLAEKRLVAPGRRGHADDDDGATPLNSEPSSHSPKRLIRLANLPQLESTHEQIQFLSFSRLRVSLGLSR